MCRARYQTKVFSIVNVIEEAFFLFYVMIYSVATLAFTRQLRPKLGRAVDELCTSLVCSIFILCTSRMLGHAERARKEELENSRAPLQHNDLIQEGQDVAKDHFPLTSRICCPKIGL